jgi:hypothetical protein
VGHRDRPLGGNSWQLVKEAEVDTNDRPTRPLYRGPERYQLERMGDLGTSNLSASHLAVSTENVKPPKSSSKVLPWLRDPRWLLRLGLRPR